ncbi:hypothetical protein H3286_28665, partial [Escherichia coli]|nr:hypothetical protein [Escherichia coli]
IEQDFNAETKKELEKMGYKFVERKNGWCKIEGIRILPNKRKETAADRRGDDSVAGF